MHSVKPKTNFLTGTIKEYCIIYWVWKQNTATTVWKKIQIWINNDETFIHVAGWWLTLDLCHCVTQKDTGWRMEHRVSNYCKWCRYSHSYLFLFPPSIHRKEHRISADKQHYWDMKTIVMCIWLWFCRRCVYWSLTSHYWSKKLTAVHTLYLKIRGHFILSKS